MKYLSVCSGIEAASVAWELLGWRPVAFSEVEAFPSAVLAERFPNTPNWGDMTNYQEWLDADVDVLVGGTPCQSFSVAGLRKGLDDPRGNLALTYLAIAERYRPEWVVWENVPGVLSSNGGRDFGAFLGALGQLGYGWAYRIIDAQYTRARGFPRAVPQRRRRVFVVGRSGGGWRAPASVLFESHCLRGDSAPRREKREGVAPTISARTKGGGVLGTDTELDGGLVAQCVTTGTGQRYDAETETLIPFDTTQVTSATNRSQPKLGDPSHPLAAGAHAPAVAFEGEVGQGMTVRRLTPTECERLQGFPDGYTDVPYRGKRAADGPRYKALGNSMAVNVVRWIGERIELYRQIECELGEEAAA